VIEILSSLRRLDLDPDVEVIVLARGGGSVEDLLPFSDEALVRAVAACRTPVVSAIGHEQDSPLLDLVADVRASTPTDAAKCIVPAVAEELALINSLRTRARTFVERTVSHQQAWLTDVRTRPVLAQPDRAITSREVDLEAARERLRDTLSRRIDNAESALAHTRDRMRSLSPRATLERGYAVLLNGEGAAVRSVADIESGGALTAVIADGRLDLTVDAVSKQ
jgi:exodeoxyribonuclease VII large subunit